MQSFKYICNMNRPFHMMDTKWLEFSVVYEEVFEIF